MVREWIPISTSPKGRLVLAAVRSFGNRSFDEVTVTELAADAGVTTGALYHHFESKLGLYAFVRGDVERRLLDRMAGAGAAHSDSDNAAITAAYLVGFDFAVSEGFIRLLGDPPAGPGEDALVALLTDLSGSANPALGRVLAAAWRAALLAVADGVSSEQARAALRSVQGQ